jgi:hypothetical protein
MSYNGSGTFIINSTGQPVVANTVISATVFNALTADLASGLTNCITKDGQSTPTANIPMGSNKITGLANGTLIGDAANLGQVQSTAAKLISITGTDTVLGTMSPTLTAYAAGQLFYFVASGANTGAVTLNIDALGAKNITRDGSTALAAGDINSGEIVVVIYDGTRFQMINAANSFGNTTINGTLTVTGNTGLQANVSVTSALSVGGTFAVTGAATLGSTLAVTGKSDLPTVSTASANAAVAVITDLSAAGASITSANVGTAVITTGTVTNLTATSASVASVNAGVALLTTATVTNLTATGASIASANLGNAVISALTLASVSVASANFGVANITDLRATGASVTSANVGTAVITTGTITNLTATSASVASANAAVALVTTGTITNLTSTAASIASANVGTAVITGLTVTGASIASANAGNVQATIASVGSANLGTAVITTGTLTNLTATSASVASVNAAVALVTTGTVTNLTSTAASIASANIGVAAIGTLSFTGASIASLNAGTATITTVNATTVDATNVEVTNVKAKDGTAAIVISDTSGNVGIGGAAAAGRRLDIAGTLPEASGFAIPYSLRGTIPSTATTVYGYYSTPTTEAASFTLTSLNHFFANPPAFGAGSTVTNQYGFIAGSTLTGATNNFGFYSNIASGSNRWNFYAAGTADNYFAGNVGIGTATPSYPLDIRTSSGSANFRLLTSGTTINDDTILRFTIGGTTAENLILFGDNDSGSVGQIRYDHTTDSLEFYANAAERMRIAADGSVGIGGTADAASRFEVLGTAPSSGGTSRGIRINQTIPSATTGSAVGFVSTASTQDASFTLTSIFHFNANGATIGSGSTVTNQYGYIVQSSLTTATNNYGFYSDIASGSNRWNLYCNGTAENYVANNLKIGGTAARATTAGTNQLVLFNGTAPVGTLANGVSFYSASGEANVMDAAGNATLLSPHDSETNEWIFRSKHTPTGKVLKIDVEKMLRFINEHFGLDMVHEFTE